LVKTNLDQRQAYKLLLEVQLVYRSVQDIEQVELLCDVLFGLLKKMSYNHAKYEKKVKDMLSYLI